jgi:hypothetical protein
MDILCYSFTNYYRLSFGGETESRPYTPDVIWRNNISRF